MDATMTTIHPYVIKKARAAFAAAGGDPEKAEALAQWAQSAKAWGDIHQGVIIGQSGTIYAQTRIGTGPGSHVLKSDAQALGLMATELGLAIGAIKRRSGEPVIHIKASGVTSGSAQFIKEA